MSNENLNNENPHPETRPDAVQAAPERKPDPPKSGKPAQPKKELTPAEQHWTSPVTKAEYTVTWKLEIPEAGVSLDLSPIVESQEMLFGLVHYWEGPIKISGTYKGERVRGDGFQELVGYRKHISHAELMGKELVQEIKGLFERH